MKTPMCEVCNTLIRDNGGLTHVCHLCEEGGWCRRCAKPQRHDCEALPAPRVAAWVAAMAVLCETGNPAVMCGDEGLLHLIAERLGWPYEAWLTSARVMAALNRTPGRLIKRKIQLLNGRVVSVFHLPESVA